MKTSLVAYFRRSRLALLVSLVAGLASGASPAYPLSIGSQSGARALVIDVIDDGRRVILPGNTRSEANAANDRGIVEGTLALDHMQLLLRRPSEREQALQQLMTEQQTPGSPNYHHWLTAQELASVYGPAQTDVDAVTTWLSEKGFTIHSVNAGHTMVDFSGTADLAKSAFGTELHHLRVNGVSHFANMSDPKIPAALAPVVAGIVSLHDFRPHTNYKPHPEYTYTSGGGSVHALVPADLATIYNLNPLFAAGIKGQGQTIVLIEDTNVFSTADISTFRSTFGLGTATFTQVHPGGCTNPGDVPGNDGEATLDVEWAAATAPGATLELASCADTATSFGGLIAMQNLINASSPPAIMSVSYGECEAENGAAANAAYLSTYQQAAAEGVSVFVSSGDEGAASCDPNASSATHGIAVSGFASTPYNVAVGGTDYSDAYSGTSGNYWNTTNSTTFGSAKSYIPEIPWNDSCASQLISSYSGSTSTYGSSGFCNSTSGTANFLTTGSGSGGPSGCATGTPSTTGVVSGSCAGTGKPAWQSGFLGNPNDGVRDIPDISLFAANGVWGHYYVYCYSGSSADGGAPCTGAPSGWSGAGGTSFSSPIMAAIQSLVNQKTGSRAGNPNPVYYQLAAAEYGSAGSSSCNSSNGNAVGSACTFYDVTQGDMDVNCTGTHNCYRPSGTNGVLSTSTSAYAQAYGTGTGWDFATGIGTINAANLVNGWPVTGATADYSLSVSVGSISVNQGANTTATITVTPQNGFSGSVALVASGLPSGVTASFSPASTTGTSTLTLTASSTATTGTSTFTIVGSSGSLTHTTAASLTVNAVAPANYTLSASSSSVAVTQGASTTSTITVTKQNGFSGSVALSASGLPAGVSASFNPASTTSTSILTLTASSTATTGASTVTVTGTSGTLVHTTSVALTVSAVNQANYSLSASPASLTENQGAKTTSTITVTKQNGFSGSVALSVSGLPSGVTASFNPASTTSTSTLTLTASSSATSGVANLTITGTSGSLSHAVALSLTVNAVGSSQQLIGNPGFENGSSKPAPWTATAGVLNSSSTERPHTGIWDAWLDGYGRSHTDTLSQAISVPAGKTSVTLAFYLHIDTAETTKTLAIDTLKVQILDASGNVLSTPATYSNLNAASGYVLQTFNLAAYAGKSITLKFTATENSSLQTSFVIDDATLTVQ